MEETYDMQGLGKVDRRGGGGKEGEGETASE